MGQPSWYAEPEGKRGESVCRTVQAIRDGQGAMFEMNRRHMRMYRNMAVMGFGPSSHAVADAGAGAPLSLNVVRNMCNTVTSKITKARPRPMFQTNGATAKMRQKAKLLQRLVEGMFYEQKVYEKTPYAFLDCGVFGTGCVAVYRRGKRVVVERVLPTEIIVDTAEGMYRDPRSIHRQRYVDRGVLKKWFPEKADAIDKLEAKHGDEQDTLWTMSAEERCDQLRVIESYHRPSGPGAGDGVWCITAEDLELDSGEWKHDWFPYVFIRWSSPPIGFFGMGLAEELVGIQVEINRLVRKIQSAMALLANPYIMAKRSSAIAKGQITDMPGTIINYNDVEPRVYAPGVVHPEVFEHLDRLYTRAYEIAGVSQLSAQSQKPAGLDSGRALLTYQDVESDRFALVGREWEYFHMEIARLCIRTAELVPGYTVRAFGKESFEEISLKDDIGLDEEEWMMQVFPASLLPNTPAGRYDIAERLIQSGFVSDPGEALELIDAPDIEAFTRRATSSKRFIEKQVENMLNGGKQEVPDAHVNLLQTKSIAQQMYVEALDEGRYSDEVLEKLRKYMVKADSLIKLSMPQPPSAPPGAPMAASAPQSGPPGAPIPPNAVAA